MKLNKYENNPVLLPNEANPWESLCVCNPGAWVEDGKFYLLYRAAGHDKEHYIQLGLAVSEDGFNFKRVSDKPVFSPSSDGPDAGCIEDPRIVKFEETFYITYAYRPYAPGQYWSSDWKPLGNPPQVAPLCLKQNIANTGLAISRDLMHFKRLGRITRTNLDDRDVILFPEKINGKFVKLHRPKEWCGEKYGCQYPSIWISFSEDLMEWDNSQLLAKGEAWWEEKIGGSTPPLKTEEGWLTLYHAVDSKGTYRVGVMLLALNDPSKIIARAPEYIMEPEFEYETRGFYNGCVFPTGNVIAGDKLFVYYGGADKFCCAASCNVRELLDFVLEYKVESAATAPSTGK